ncbi:MAG: hypothetical protein SGI72_18685 [Planctomycetota bacterium]|nr:hypothetical protein [Planctomycetota bacterium]
MDKHKQTASNTTPTSKAPEVKPVKETISTSDTGEKASGHPLLFLMGAGAVLFGGALTVLPIVAREQASIVHSFAKHGVTGTPIALTGLVLCALAIVTRKKADNSASKQTAAQALLLEQLASDLALTRGGMQDLRVEFVYLKDQVQTTAMQRDLQDQQSKGDDASSAMFRLAASMDQLTGRLETRMKALDGSLAEQFAQVRGEVGDVRNHVGELRSRIEEGMQAAASEEHVGEAYHTSDERQIEIEHGYQPHEDDIEVTVEFEEEEPSGLGLLDEFDDHGRHKSQKQSPSIRPSRNSTHLDSQGGLLPSRTNGHREREMSVDEKLAALRTLMSDPTVRKALESTRNRS